MPWPAPNPRAGVQNPSEAHLQNGFRCSGPEPIADFATALIATKPVKPCDGGIFGAFYLLLKLEQNGAWAALRFIAAFACLRRLSAFFWLLASACQVRAVWCLKAVSACPGPHRIRALVFRTRLKPACKTAFAALAQKPLPDFATALIATKPVKPCDRGIFGAFYLLLKLERNGAWAALRFIAAFACLRRLSAFSVFQLRPAKLGGLVSESSQCMPWPAPNPCAGVQNPSDAHLQNGFRCSGPETIARFRYGFDSNQARQTVRWRHFWGLLFALETGAKTRQAAAGWGFFVMAA